MFMTPEQITQIILAVISIIGTLIGAFLVPLIRTKTTKEQREFAEKVIREAVRAAEQIFNLQGQGIEKYDFVIKYIKAEFKLSLSEKEIKVLIEAAVNELNENKEKI